MKGAAIIRAGSDSWVDKDVLKGCGFKLRTGVSCTPDLILTIKGLTGAFILLPDPNVSHIDRQAP